MKYSNPKKKYEANMKNVIDKKILKCVQQITAIELHKTKKLSMSTLDEILDKPYRWFFANLSSFRLNFRYVWQYL